MRWPTMQAEPGQGTLAIEYECPTCGAKVRAERALWHHQRRHERERRETYRAQRAALAPEPEDAAPAKASVARPTERTLLCPRCGRAWVAVGRKCGLCGARRDG